MGKKVNSETNPVLIEAANLVEKYLEDANAAPFWGPVLWKEWSLHDYPKIVKEPMDLGWVKRNLAASKYDSDLVEFARHVRLVWGNCMLYNQEKSDYHKRARKFDKQFNKDLRKILQIRNKYSGSRSGEKNSTSANHRGPSLDEKASFCDMILQINELNRGKLVQSLDESCEKALVKHSAHEVEINVDAIDLANFRKHEALLKKFILEEKTPKTNGDSAESQSEKRRVEDSASEGKMELSTKKCKTEDSNNSEA